MLFLVFLCDELMLGFNLGRENLQLQKIGTVFL
jgi:hypothetical protein